MDTGHLIISIICILIYFYVFLYIITHIHMYIYIFIYIKFVLIVTVISVRGYNIMCTYYTGVNDPNREQSYSVGIDRFCTK